MLKTVVLLNIWAETALHFMKNIIYYYLYIFTIIFNVFCELMLLKVAMKQNSFVKITIRSITRIMKIDRNVCFMMTLICKCIVCFACK